MAHQYDAGQNIHDRILHHNADHLNFQRYGIALPPTRLGYGIRRTHSSLLPLDRQDRLWI